MSAMPLRSHATAEPRRPDWLPRSAFPFQTRFAVIDGKTIHYVDEGSGPALLLVSAGQWSFIFRDVIVRLRGEFRCVTLDFPGCGLSPVAPGHDNGVRSNARILDGFIDALDLQDITMVVHDVGGPIGFLVAIGRPARFRGLVISNSFAWPLRGYPAVRAMLTLVSSRPFGAINDLTNLLARTTATSYGVGRHLSRADRRAFLAPWRARSFRRATLQVLGGVLSIDDTMAEVERSLPAALRGLPILTLFGRRNDPYGWQERFGRMFPQAAASGIARGRHFPFNDDPQAYNDAICSWWADGVATADMPASRAADGNDRKDGERSDAR
jgi:haloalkane dehalogenase